MQTTITLTLVCPSVRPSVCHKTVSAQYLKYVFMKLHSNIKHHQTTSRPQEPLIVFIYIYIFHETCFFNKRSGAVVMTPDSEGLGAAVVVSAGSNLTQSSGISYFSLYTFF